MHLRGGNQPNPRKTAWKGKVSNSRVVRDIPGCSCPVPEPWSRQGRAHGHIQTLPMICGRMRIPQG